MAEAAVTFLLTQVTEVLKEYHNLIAGAESEFNQLSNDLSSLKAFLKEMAKKKKKDDLLRVLERRIRTVVYEVEDTMDSCMTKVIESKASHSLVSAILPTRSFSLAREVKSMIEEKVQPLFNDASKFADMKKLADGSGGVELPRTTLTRVEPIARNRIVGFKDQEDVIVELLKKQTESLDVISIVGVPGQGKTTLAWMVHDNQSIELHFSIRIWVYISEQFNCRDVFIQILAKLSPNHDANGLTDDELVRTLKNYLRNTTFLLVLDDVWSVGAWDEIQQVLPQESGDSKVIITSRDENVGEPSVGRRTLYRLQFLTQDESWELLQYVVFGNLEDCPPELRGIGENIAKNCDGVPLTIIVIGGILEDQQRASPLVDEALEDWERVSKNVSDALQKDPKNRITNVVDLSYQRLPENLRDCFVYLGVFPEDYEISVKMLCGLWIAEGFIQRKDDTKTLEETAQDNLADLITRNLLKVDKTNHRGKPKTCRVHDMIRAFCIAKAKEQILFKEIKNSGVPETSEHLQVETFHRLCFHSELNNFLSRNPRDPHVRSILCFYKQPMELMKRHVSVIPSGYPKLRVFESKTIKFPMFPAKITKLKHVRYLTLNIDTLEMLPESISQMWNLQTLILETKAGVIKMKANMWRMIRLRHLKTKAAIALDTNWQGEAGQNLLTLDRVTPESCTEAISNKAKNLKTLGISGKLTNIFQTKFLEKLERLENLKLVNDFFENRPQVPREQNCFPPNLKRLTLTNTFLNSEHMSTLAMIKTLEALKLKNNAFAGRRWNVGVNRFPKLQLLLIENMVDLGVWEATTDNFPNLRFLVINNCPNLIKIPECLGMGNYLTKLEIERVCPSVVNSARKIEETRKKNLKGGKFAEQFDLHIGPVCLTQ